MKLVRRCGWAREAEGEGGLAVPVLSCARLGGVFGAAAGAGTSPLGLCFPLSSVMKSPPRLSFTLNLTNVNFSLTGSYAVGLII